MSNPLPSLEHLWYPYLGLRSAPLRVFSEDRLQSNGVLFATDKTVVVIDNLHHQNDRSWFLPSTSCDANSSAWVRIASGTASTVKGPTPQSRSR